MLAHFQSDTKILNMPKSNSRKLMGSVSPTRSSPILINNVKPKFQESSPVLSQKFGAEEDLLEVKA